MYVGSVSSCWTWGNRWVRYLAVSSSRHPLRLGESNLRTKAQMRNLRSVNRGNGTATLQTRGQHRVRIRPGLEICVYPLRRES
jgi:hypothetical protein